MKVLALVIASTFNADRKYLRFFTHFFTFFPFGCGCCYRSWD